jgi:hypothetical protein
MCSDRPSLADGRAYTDSSWRFYQVDLEKIEEERQPSGAPALPDIGRRAETLSRKT